VVTRGGLEISGCPTILEELQWGLSERDVSLRKEKRLVMSMTVCYT
jgi:hypothetical protein